MYVLRFVERSPEKAALYHWAHRASTSLLTDLAEQGSGREPQDPGTHRVHDREFLIAPRTAPSSFVSVSARRRKAFVRRTAVAPNRQALDRLRQYSGRSRAFSKAAKEAI